MKKVGAFDLHADSNVLTSLSSKVLNNEVSMSIKLKNINDLRDLTNMDGKYNLSSIELINCKNLTSLNGISSMSNTTVITATGCSSLVKLTGLRSLLKLNKLVINNSGITDLSELSGLTSLNYIDLKNNLSLSNKYLNVDNLQIIADLRGENRSLKVYLAGNINILDWSKLSVFENWWHDSEKAGY